MLVDDDALLEPVDALGDVEVLNPDDVGVEDAPLEVLGVKVGKIFDVVTELACDEPPTMVVDVTWSAVVVCDPVREVGIACVDVSGATGEEKEPFIPSRLYMT